MANKATPLPMTSKAASVGVNEPVMASNTLLMIKTRIKPVKSAPLLCLRQDLTIVSQLVSCSQNLCDCSKA